MDIKVTVNIPQLDDLRRLVEHLELVIAQTPQAGIELEHEEPRVQVASTPVEAQAEPEMSLEAVQKIMYKVSGKIGKDKVKEELAKFGVSKVSAVAPEDRAKLAEALQALVGGEADA